LNATWDSRQKTFLEQAEKAIKTMNITGKCEGYFDTITWQLILNVRGPDPETCQGCYFYLTCQVIRLDMAKKLNGKADK
jgi:hypothetical protein